MAERDRSDQLQCNLRNVNSSRTEIVCLVKFAPRIVHLLRTQERDSHANKMWLKPETCQNVASGIGDGKTHLKCFLFYNCNVIRNTFLFFSGVCNRGAFGANAFDPGAHTGKDECPKTDTFYSICLDLLKFLGWLNKTVSLNRIVFLSSASFLWWEAWLTIFR